MVGCFYLPCRTPTLLERWTCSHLPALECNCIPEAPLQCCQVASLFSMYLVLFLKLNGDLSLIFSSNAGWLSSCPQICLLISLTNNQRVINSGRGTLLFYTFHSSQRSTFSLGQHLARIYMTSMKILFSRCYDFFALAWQKMACRRHQKLSFSSRQRASC